MPNIQHAEEIAQKWFPATNTIRIDAIRSASLDGELREVTYRRLSSINVTWGQAATRSTMRLDRDEVTWLRDALTASLEATDDLADIEPTPPTATSDPAGTSEQEASS